jgi:proteasome alpha subunit
MSMPFYVSPEQLMKDRADYARKGIARGRSVVVLSTPAGSSSSRRTRPGAAQDLRDLRPHRLRRRRQVQRVREPARRRRPATPTCAATPTTARDVTGAAWPTPTRRPSARSSPRVQAVRGRDRRRRGRRPPHDDQIYRLTYDGSVADEHGFVAMGGRPSRSPRPGGALAPRACPRGGPAARGGPGAAAARRQRHPGRAAHAHPAQLEVAVLDRDRPRRKFRRITGAAELLGTEDDSDDAAGGDRSSRTAADLRPAPSA